MVLDVEGGSLVKKAKGMQKSKDLCKRMVVMRASEGRRGISEGSVGPMECRSHSQNNQKNLDQ